VYHSRWCVKVGVPQVRNFGCPFTQVSVTRGDHEGFDILSFESGGTERLVEVKTTGFGR
jgi:hypothetical protein